MIQPRDGLISHDASYPPTEGRRRRRSLEWCGSGGGGSALGKAKRNPTRRAAPTKREGRKMDDSRTIGGGAEADFFSLCRWLRRGETPNGNEPTTFHSRHRPPEKKNRNHHIDRAQEKEREMRRSEAEGSPRRSRAAKRSQEAARASRRERGKTVKRENHLTTTNDDRRPSGGRIAGECPLGAGK